MPPGTLMTEPLDDLIAQGSRHAPAPRRTAGARAASRRHVKEEPPRKKQASKAPAAAPASPTHIPDLDDFDKEFDDLIGCSQGTDAGTPLGTPSKEAREAKRYETYLARMEKKDKQRQKTAKAIEKEIQQEEKEKKKTDREWKALKRKLKRQNRERIAQRKKRAAAVYRSTVGDVSLVRPSPVDPAMLAPKPSNALKDIATVLPDVALLADLRKHLPEGCADVSDAALTEEAIATGFLARHYHTANKCSRAVMDVLLDAAAFALPHTQPLAEHAVKTITQILTSHKGRAAAPNAAPTAGRIVRILQALGYAYGGDPQDQPAIEDTILGSQAGGDDGPTCTLNNVARVLRFVAAAAHRIEFPSVDDAAALLAATIRLRCAPHHEHFSQERNSALNALLDTLFDPRAYERRGSGGGVAAGHLATEKELQEVADRVCAEVCQGPSHACVVACVRALPLKPRVRNGDDPDAPWAACNQTRVLRRRMALCGIAGILGAPLPQTKARADPVHVALTLLGDGRELARRAADREGGMDAWKLHSLLDLLYVLTETQVQLISRPHKAADKDLITGFLRGVAGFSQMVGRNEPVALAVRIVLDDLQGKVSLGETALPGMELEEAKVADRDAVLVE
ncbi:unnamed protein product [Pedinophyceae sp. YPF-701]|nr:unnamed protein product [Pedinophyceae sp. YPF-701]